MKKLIVFLTVCLFAATSWALQNNVASQKIAIYAYDSVSGEPVTGDAGNITAKVWQDWTSEAASNDTNPTELDSTDSPGIYLFDMLQAETAGDVIHLDAISSTAFVEIDTVTFHTTPENFPDESVSASIANGLDIVIPASPTKDSINDRVKTGIIDIVESQRGWHTQQGNIFYVDPINGDTHANGNRGGRVDPYLTIQDCHDNAVVAWNHDVIILIAGDAVQPTVHTVNAETTITKAYTFVRGPGRDMLLTRGNAGNTIVISSAPGIEISGCQIGTFNSGSGNGVDVTDSDYVRIRNCWFLDTQGDGAHLLRVDHAQIHDNHFEGTGVGGSGQGIHIVGTGGASNDNVIRDNHFARTGGTSILIEQGITNDTQIHNNEFHSAGGWGVHIGASSTDAFVHSNIFASNTLGNINDEGTDTGLVNNDQWSIHPAADIWGVTMENSKTYAEVMRVFAAVLSGKSSIASGQITFVGIDGTTNRLVVTVASGARTSVDTWDGGL